MTYLGDFGMATLVVLALLFWKFKYAVIAILSFVASAGITQFLKKMIYLDVNVQLIMKIVGVVSLWRIACC